MHSLQQENRQIRYFFHFFQGALIWTNFFYRQLQEENRQLKLALEEHQAALDLIMLRYRQQVLQMVQMNWVQKIAEKAVDAARVSIFSFHQISLVKNSFLDELQWRRFE